MKASRMDDALLSEASWNRSFYFSVGAIEEAVLALAEEYQEKHKEEAFFEATVLKSKLTQVIEDSKSFNSLDPDETNKINAEMLEKFAFGRKSINPNPNVIHSERCPKRIRTLRRTMRGTTRQPCMCIDINFEPVWRTGGV